MSKQDQSKVMTCAYNFCKAGISEYGPPCYCFNNHLQPCCKGDSY